MNIDQIIEKIGRIQRHVESGGANEDLTAATVLCSEVADEVMHLGPCWACEDCGSTAGFATVWHIVGDADVRCQRCGSDDTDELHAVMQRLVANREDWDAAVQAGLLEATDGTLIDLGHEDATAVAVVEQESGRVVESFTMSSDPVEQIAHLTVALTEMRDTNKRLVTQKVDARKRIEELWVCFNEAKAMAERAVLERSELRGQLADAVLRESNYLDKMSALEADRDAARAEAEALRRERGTLRDVVDAFKEASGLTVGGDPDGVTPEHVERFLAKMETQVVTARESVRELVAVARKQADVIAESAMVSHWVANLNYTAAAEWERKASAMYAEIDALLAKHADGGA